MWLVTQNGFFNVIQYPEDQKNDLLTIKARRELDLIQLKQFIPIGKIEFSDRADYKYRTKAKRSDVQAGMAEMIGKIDYDKTKSRLTEVHPDRSDIYLSTWGILCELDECAV